MKIEGYVICCPINTWGDETKDKWHPYSNTFGHTAQEAWIRYLCIYPSNDDWDRKVQAWINRGYCPKKVVMEVFFEDHS